MSCPSKTEKGVSIDAGALATVNVTGQANLNYSIAASGTVVPPDLVDLGASACEYHILLLRLHADTTEVFNGSISGVISVDSNLEVPLCGTYILLTDNSVLLGQH